MNRNHTPGPWMADKDLTISNIRNNPDKEVPVCQVYDTSFNNEAHANVKLISAAPDLLDIALQFKEYLISKGEKNSLIMMQIDLTLIKAI